MPQPVELMRILGWKWEGSIEIYGMQIFWNIRVVMTIVIKCSPIWGIKPMRMYGKFSGISWCISWAWWSSLVCLPCYRYCCFPDGIVLLPQTCSDRRYMLLKFEIFSPKIEIGSIWRWHLVLIWDLNMIEVSLFVGKLQVWFGHLCFDCKPSGVHIQGVGVSGFDRWKKPIENLRI